VAATGLERTETERPPGLNAARSTGFRHNAAGEVHTSYGCGCLKPGSGSLSPVQRGGMGSVVVVWPTPPA
jgi:hypothetical protein